LRKNSACASSSFQCSYAVFLHWTIL
jgi:hypothetical protein